MSFQVEAWTMDANIVGAKVAFETSLTVDGDGSLFAGLTGGSIPITVRAEVHNIVHMKEQTVISVSTGRAVAQFALKHDDYVTVLEGDDR